MDDHLRAMERITTHTEHVARVNADGWQRAHRPRPSLRTRFAAALVALAARLDATALPARSETTALPAPISA